MKKYGALLLALCLCMPLTGMASGCPCASVDGCCALTCAPCVCMMNYPNAILLTEVAPRSNATSPDYQYTEYTLTQDTVVYNSATGGGTGITLPAGTTVLLGTTTFGRINILYNNEQNAGYIVMGEVKASAPGTGAAAGSSTANAKNMLRELTTLVYQINSAADAVFTTDESSITTILFQSGDSLLDRVKEGTVILSTDWEDWYTYGMSVLVTEPGYANTAFRVAYAMLLDAMQGGEEAANAEDTAAETMLAALVGLGLTPSLEDEDYAATVKGLVSRDYPMESTQALAEAGRALIQDMVDTCNEGILSKAEELIEELEAMTNLTDAEMAQLEALRGVLQAAKEALAL